MTCNSHEKAETDGRRKNIEIGRKRFRFGYGGKRWCTRLINFTISFLHAVLSACGLTCAVCFSALLLKRMQRMNVFQCSRGFQSTTDIDKYTNTWLIFPQPYVHVGQFSEGEYGAVSPGVVELARERKLPDEPWSLLGKDEGRVTLFSFLLMTIFPSSLVQCKVE